MHLLFVLNLLSQADFYHAKNFGLFQYQFFQKEILQSFVEDPKKFLYLPYERFKASETLEFIKDHLIEIITLFNCFKNSFFKKKNLNMKNF